jgi:hypothetical protein
MTVGNAKQKLSEAIYAIRQAQVGFGRGAGGRELALAATNAEQAEHWLLAAERARDAEGVGGTSEAPPSGVASTNNA